MAIAQEIIITASGLSFEDWIASLTGDAKTEAEAAVADRNAKFDAQVAAGNVYFNKDSKRVWVSAEAEQAHMEELGQAYADLWAQWEEETGGTLTVNVIESPSGTDTALAIDDWAKENLSAEDFATFVTQMANINSAANGRSREDIPAEELASLQAANPVFKSTKEAYDAYVASL